MDDFDMRGFAQFVSEQERAQQQEYMWRLKYAPEGKIEETIDQVKVVTYDPARAPKAPKRYGAGATRSRFK